MKILVVHRGRRDNYEVANALQMAGHEVYLVTSAYSSPIIRTIAKFVPMQALQQLAGRRSKRLIDVNVKSSLLNELILRVLGKVLGKAFTLQAFDTWMYKAAMRVIHANQIDCIVCYNYNAFKIFSDIKSYSIPKILFQCHPHPFIIREQFFRLINKKMLPSVNCEMELSWPAGYQAMIMVEPLLANAVICASSFTRKSLLMAGVDDKKISVVPYGVGMQFKQINARSIRSNRHLRLIFVGQFVYRKGLSFLLRILNRISFDIDMIFIGRGLSEINPSDAIANPKVNVSVYWNIPLNKLIDLYQSADIFIFPSVIEGFAHVILEAMQSGCVPIVSNATCGPDVIRHGIDGFVIPIIDEEGYLEAIESLIDPIKLLEMAESAKARASLYTWDKFRLGVADEVVNSYNRIISEFEDVYVGQEDCRIGSCKSVRSE